MQETPTSAENLRLAFVQFPMSQSAQTIRWRTPLSARVPLAAPAIAGAVALGVGSVLLGLALPRLTEIAIGTPAAVLLPVGVITSLAVVAAGRVACLAAIVALTAAGLRIPVGQLSGADITVADFFFGALVAWWAAGALRGLAARERPVPAERFGQAAAVAFIAYAGLSVLAVEGTAMGEATISWLRFAHTALIAWLVAATIRSKRDLGILLVAGVAGGLVAVGSTVVELASVGGVGDRHGGLLGANAVGLLSGVMIVMAFFAPIGRAGSAGLGYRIPMVLFGLVGLLVGKSVGGTVATCLALAIGFGFRGRATPVQRMGALLVAVALAVFIVVGMIGFLRPSASPTSDNFRDSSTAQRAILGAAAIEIFKDRPVFGVGWRQSDEPTIIGSREVNVVLRKRFEGARHDFFPDAVDGNPGSVHNTYLQILADTGLIGFGLFAAALVGLALGARRLLGRIDRDDPLWKATFAVALSLLLAFVFLNDNPLYGGQFDTVLIAVLAGSLVAISGMAARRSVR